MFAFGPVPSRRLGRSLGINNIPAKICSYACAYCQLGNTTVKSAERRAYYGVDDIYTEVEEKVREAEEEAVAIDYLTFVPDGEPTLDANLGKEADLLGSLGIKLAIITNASLLWREDVRSALLGFDYVSVKLDAVSEEVWKRVNRPHESLKHDMILEGMLDFRDEFSGTLVTETMLVDTVDYGREIRNIRDFLGELSPDIAYISVPTRPPAEEWAKAPGEDIINMVFQELSGVVSAECLTGYEGKAFSGTGDPEEDLLAITSVHPMREDAVDEFLRKRKKGRQLVKKMVSEGKLIVLEYNGKKYLMRKIASR